MGFNITSLIIYVQYLFCPLKINLKEAIISVSGCRKHSHTGNTRNVRSPESPGVIAGRGADLLNQPTAKLKKILYFRSMLYKWKIFSPVTAGQQDNSEGHPSNVSI